MDPRQACLDCLAQEPPALFEAALWIAAEHLPAYSPAHAEPARSSAAAAIRPTPHWLHARGSSAQPQCARPAMQMTA